LKETAVADAPVECFFVDPSNKQQGPVGSAEIVRLIRSGTIRRDTLIWYTGMTDWRPAGEVSGLASLFAAAGPSAPPPPAARARPPAASYSPTDARIAATFGAAGPSDGLIAVLPVWGLFWRAMVAGLGGALVIPAPWTYTMFYKFTTESISLPDGRRLTFAGKPLDIWYVFIGLALLGLVPLVYRPLQLITMPLSFLLSYLALRWVCDKVGSEDGSVRLAFTGSIWGYFGWYLLLIVSFITIIGWAWVLQFMMRWVCRNVSGTEAFDFTGTGLSILWRTLVFGFAFIFLIPIPWVLRWYTVWFISQVRAGASEHA
jgi:hypothetical protein